MAGSPSRTDGGGWGRSPSPARPGLGLQQAASMGYAGYGNAGSAIQEYHAGEVRVTQETATAGGELGRSRRGEAIEAPEELLPLISFSLASWLADSLSDSRAAARLAWHSNV